MITSPIATDDAARSAGRIYTDYKLYHRTPSDGFFAVRYGCGFFITATKTHKSPLDLNRVSFVHHYNEEKNELFYSGKYLPSSDVVEAFIVFRDNPEITSIIHTHASDRYTRNPAFESRIEVGRDSYGIPELGRKINKVVKNYLDSFLILREHGEVFPLTGSILEIPKKMEQLVTKDCHEPATL